jgi:cytochrome c oxidase assembly factor 4
MSKQEAINLDMNEDDDPISKTGCQTLNEAVLLCFEEHKDWRKCQKEVMAFKACFEMYAKDIKQDE